jgi:hypothetical protein
MCAGDESKQAPSRAAALEAPPYREPFRSAIVIATCATFVTTVALLTAGATIRSLFGKNPIRGTPEPEW